MKCTIQNIADHLGLSRNTVSKALKNSSEVSENTRNLVIKTASKLGYKNATFATPVIAASETGSNGTILFLTRTYASDSEFWTTVLRGIESILSNANYHLAISIMSDSDLKQLNFHKLFPILLSKELFLLRSVIKLYAMLSHNLIFQLYL